MINVDLYSPFNVTISRMRSFIGECRIRVGLHAAEWAGNEWNSTDRVPSLIKYLSLLRLTLPPLLLRRRADICVHRAWMAGEYNFKSSPVQQLILCELVSCISLNKTSFIAHIQLPQVFNVHFNPRFKMPFSSIYLLFAHDILYFLLIWAN